MELRLEVGDILDTEADCIVVNLLQGVTEPGGATGAVDQVMGGVIKQLIEDGDIKGKAGELTLVQRRRKWFELVEAMMGDFNTTMERNISSYLTEFLR